MNGGLAMHGNNAKLSCGDAGATGCMGLQYSGYPRVIIGPIVKGAVCLFLDRDGLSSGLIGSGVGYIAVS